MTEIVEVDPSRADEVADAARLLTAAAAAHPVPEGDVVADEVVQLLHPPSNRWRRILLARDGADAVGVATVQARTRGGSEHFGRAVPLFVTPTVRRRGVGSSLVAAARELLRAGGQTELWGRHLVDDRGAAAFAAAHGATEKETSDQRRATVGDIDRAVLEAWVARASERAGGCSLVGWDNRCPEELVDAYANVQAVMDDAPRGGLTTMRFTADDIREAEAGNDAMGLDHWVIVVREDESGDLVGFTEVLFQRRVPWLARQGDTGVAPSQRERGLGRWLKAAMALRILEERPEVTHIETLNASSNAPMIALNDEMGFRLALVWRDCALDV